MTRKTLRRIAVWLGLAQSVDDYAAEVIEAMRSHPSYSRAHRTDCVCGDCRAWWDLIDGHPGVHDLESLARRLDGEQR